MSETLMRSVTILVISSLLGTIFIFGNNLSFIIATFIISFYAFYEWITFTSESKLYLLLFVIFITAIYYLPFNNIEYLSVATLSIWSVLIILMFFFTSSLKYLIKKYSNFIGFFIVTPFFYHLVNFFSNNTFNDDNLLLEPKYTLLLFILLLSIIDIFSYLSGKIFGSFKIVPNISPNKTVEGYIGGYISTIILTVVSFEILLIEWEVVDLVYLTLLIFFAFTGDLFMSIVKRTFQIKDTGNLLPGHGGLLDRLDSYFPSISLFSLWVMI